MPHALDAFGTSKKALRSPCISAFMSVCKAWHTKIDFPPPPTYIHLHRLRQKLDLKRLKESIYIKIVNA